VYSSWSCRRCLLRRVHGSLAREQVWLAILAPGRRAPVHPVHAYCGARGVDASVTDETYVHIYALARSERVEVE
jgi:hypothetical protein